MFSVFRGPKYDDIRPNHTKKKTKNQTNKKNTNAQKPCELMDQTRNFFSPGFPQAKRCKNIDVSEFSREVCIHRVWKIAKNQSHLVKFGCESPLI